MRPCCCCCCCRREALVAGSQQRSAAKETEATAELDNRGLLQLQQQVMQQQDQELEQMEKTVISTKVGIVAFESAQVQLMGSSRVHRDLCLTSSHMTCCVDSFCYRQSVAVCICTRLYW